ncbi:MAG: hypothetical protein A2V88_09255 [Elusimicrobia bacterium RBG_16_66_12]|nr:MAG: hypothetical protein A2V88_09255 [Elusimicrobia bacterium RBG_16_66_12]
MAARESDDGAVPLGFIVFGFLTWSVLRSAATPATSLNRQIMAWQPTPQTVAGAAVGLAGKGDIFGHLLRASVAAAGNKARPAAAALALCGLALFAYPLLIRRYGPLLAWSDAALAAAGGFTGAAGVGGLLAVPLAWPALLRWPSLTVAALNAVAGVVALALYAQRGHEGQRVLEHGPAFVPPELSGAGAVLVGRADSAILPGHARWLAVAGGDIKIPFDRLSRGITVLGEKGAGKSRLLFTLHDAIREHYPDVPILIHDPKGEWYRTYYNPDTDIYFAPHFEGSARWGIWRDFQIIPELRHSLLTSTVHAHPTQGDSFWMDQAVDMLEHAASFPDFGRACEYLTAIATTKADDKFLMSVFGTARLGFLDIAKAQVMNAKKEPASIDDFLKRKGRILLLNDPSCADQQRGVFNLFLTAFLLRVLSMPDVPAHKLRAVAIIDEALTFHLPPDIDRRIYALCRSKGLCIIAGAQRLPDSHNHERGEWQHAEYTVAMKVIHQATQASLSKRAGSLLFKQKKKSTTTNQGGGSESESVQDSRQDAIPPEHFGRLAPREFVLFHDRGLITGKTTESPHEQRQVALPQFDPLQEVTTISRKMMVGG